MDGTPEGSAQTGSNPASRLLALVTKLKQQPEGANMFSAWATAFAMEPNPGTNEDRVISLQLAARREVARLRTSLSAAGRSAGLLGAAEPRLMAVAASPANHSRWKDIVGNLDGEVFGRLEVLAAFLPPDEYALDPGELDRLRSEVAEYRLTLGEAGLSERMRDYILDALDKFEAALLVYPISGAKPMAGVVREKWAEAVEGGKGLQPGGGTTPNPADSERSRNAMNGFRRIFRKVVDAAKDADTLAKGVERAAQLYDKGDEVLKLLGMG